MDELRGDQRTLLASVRSDWLTIFQLPPYAHELNPVELVWSHLKRSLANLAKRNLAQLIALVTTRLKRMQCRPALLDGFLASAGLAASCSSAWHSCRIPVWQELEGVVEP